MRETLTQERLKEVLDYDADTGIFKWREAIGNPPVGAEAGCLDSLGYIVVKIDRKPYKAHRLAFLYMEGYLPENTVDHANRKTWDNRWANLREVSLSCQNRNRSTPKNNTSGVKGVSYRKNRGKFHADVSINGVLIYLGCFSDILEAACHRLAAEQCLNFADCDRTSPAKKFIDAHLFTLKPQCHQTGKKRE